MIKLKKIVAASSFVLLLTAGCTSAVEKEEGIKSIKKSQYLYQWSGTKKNNIKLINSTLDNFYDVYDDAFNKGDYDLFKRSVLTGSPAALALKEDIDSGNFTNMTVYSYTADEIKQDGDDYIATVGHELSNASTGVRTYAEEVFHFKYNSSLKQMMISDITDVNNSELKVKDAKSAQSAAKGNGVAIDVLSTDFQNAFLADDSRYYGGVVDGMSYQVMKERYGDFTDNMMIAGSRYYIYGNAAVKFNKEITEKATGSEVVDDMVIVPTQLLYQDVAAFYGIPQKEKLEGKDPYVEYEGYGNAVMIMHLTADQKSVKYIEKRN